MKRTLSVAALSMGMTLISALGASAQDVYTNAVQNSTVTVGSATVTQSHSLTNNYSSGGIKGSSSTDTLQTLYNAGLVNIAFDQNSPQTTILSTSVLAPKPPLSALVDSVGTASNGAGGNIDFGPNGAQNPADHAPTVIDFVFNNPAAPNGYTLTDLSFFTLASGVGRSYYDLDIAYSTDGVTFTKFLTAQDQLGPSFGVNSTGGTQSYAEQFAANGFNNSFTGIKALQLTLRATPYGYNTKTLNPDGTTYTYTNPNTNYTVGTWAAEFDVNMTPTPEPSQTAALGLGVLCLAGLAFKARRRVSVS